MTGRPRRQMADEEPSRRTHPPPFEERLAAAADFFIGTLKGAKEAEMDSTSDAVDKSVVI